MGKDEREILRSVDELSKEDLELFSKKFKPTDFKHYMDLQIKWISEEKYFLGESLNKNPDDNELISAWINHNNSQRFRAFYVLRYPDKVEEIYFL